MLLNFIFVNSAMLLAEVIFVSLISLVKKFISVIVDSDIFSDLNIASARSFRIDENSSREPPPSSHSPILPSQATVKKHLHPAAFRCRSSLLLLTHWIQLQLRFW